MFLLLGFLKDTKKKQDGEDEPSTTTNVSSEVKVTGQLTLDALQVPALVTEAEIKWAVKCVMDHLSFRSCLDLNDLFRSMFPDSAVAQKFKLSKTKCAYLINFGLAVYYHKLRISEVKESPFLPSVLMRVLILYFKAAKWIVAYDIGMKKGAFRKLDT